VNKPVDKPTYYRYSKYNKVVYISSEPVMPVARILGVEHRAFKIVSMKVLGLMGSRTHSALLSIDLSCFVSSCLVLLMKVMVFPVIFSLHTECVMSL
jgi:hypothetical protein